MSSSKAASPKSPPNNVTNWESSVQIPSLRVTFLPQTSALSLSCWWVFPNFFRWLRLCAAPSPWHISPHPCPMQLSKKAATGFLNNTSVPLTVAFTVTWISDCCPGFFLVGVEPGQRTHHHCGCPPSQCPALISRNEWMLWRILQKKHRHVNLGGSSLP